MTPSKEHCERRDEDGKGQTRRRQEDVELNDVDDHRREDDEPERHHAEQQQRSADHLRGEERREHEATRRQAAEERAQKTAVKLMIPLVLFIFPAMGVVLAGPAAINVMRTLKHNPALGG